MDWNPVVFEALPPALLTTRPSSTNRPRGSSNSSAHAASGVSRSDASSDSSDPLHARKHVSSAEERPGADHRSDPSAQSRDDGGADSKHGADSGSGAAGTNGGSRAARAGSSGATRGATTRQTSKSSAAVGSRATAEGPSDPGQSDFSQAFAQSLAAAEADGAETDDRSGATTTADSQKDNSSDASATADPVSLALALVAQSLAGASPHAQAPQATGSAGTAGAAGDTAAIGMAGGGAAAGLLQDVTSLLQQGAAANDSSAATDGQDGDHTASSSHANGTADGTGATAGPNPNLQLGALSHFAKAHAAPDPAGSNGELKTSVGTPAWNDELGGHMTWMAKQGLESASLQLSPDHLGPVQVQISVRDGAASVVFGAHHADTRVAIEQALPRLRELFANQGLTLADAGVSRESPRGQPNATRTQTIGSVSDVGTSETSVTTAAIARLGLVDTYA